MVPHDWQRNSAPNEWAKFWSLDPAVTFLNHGSFGACPLPVQLEQQRLRDRLEREPVRFFDRELEPLLDDARSQLAAFVGADGAELAFVPNATTGVNAVLRSLRFCPGDELLTTDQEYNACRNALDFVAERSGVQVVTASVPFPIESPQQIIDAVMERVSANTRLVLLDHLTSNTALIFPIKQLVGQLAARDIDTLVDGAHAPGQISLNIRDLGAAYYAANCHKWLCAPKGAGFLYVRKDKQSEIRPLTISHGANSPRTERSRFHLEFDWMGTDDPTAYLCIPEAIQFLGSLFRGGWTELMERNHLKILEARELLCDVLDILPPTPEDAIGSMASLPLPDGDAETLQNTLFDKYGIQVKVSPWPRSPKRLMRICAQLYNTPVDYERLVKATTSLIESAGLKTVS